MIKLPGQLVGQGFGFCRIDRYDTTQPSAAKKPVGKGWQQIHYTDFQINEWAFGPTPNNYGVRPGRGGLLIVDADSPTLADYMFANAPETFTVQSGGGDHKFHFYYKVPDNISKKVYGTNKKLVFKAEGKDAENIGDIPIQAVGPGSLHKSGKYYEVFKDVPIAFLTSEEVIRLLSQFLPDGFFEDKVEFVPTPKTVPAEVVPSRNKPSMDAVCAHYGITRGKNCAHPVHGSTTPGKPDSESVNFSVKPDEEIAACWSHELTMDSLSLIAVMEGFVVCDENTPGTPTKKDGKKMSLTGNAYTKTLDVAKEKFGMLDPTINFSDDVTGSGVCRFVI